MAEYIDRETAIKNIKEHQCRNCSDIGLCENCAVLTAIKLFENIPAVDVQPVKWISVTERLPEEYKNVLCYYEYFRYGDFNCMFRAIDRGYYGNGIWGGEAGQGHKNKVLAWMPLPKPPKDDETWDTK